MMRRKIVASVRNFRDFIGLPLAAKQEVFHDCFSGSGPDPEIDTILDECVGWLCRAQDCSTSKDGGVSRSYSLINGWGPSYPETTGYIIPTFLFFSEIRNDDSLIPRVKRMLDWLVGIQLPGGGFQGGVVNTRTVVPVTFNTGQILLGLSRGAEKFGEPYFHSMQEAANWLVDSQDPDGCWRKHPTPFAKLGEKTYETHVSWGLFEAARVSNVGRYADAALNNINWALTKQTDNGWFHDCCLTDPTQPLTHTIGYVFRGVLEASRNTKSPEYFESAKLLGEGLLTSIQPDGFIPGRLDCNWNGTVSSACLTGSVQIAYCWLILYQETGDTRFREAAFAANKFVRKTVRLDGNLAVRGAVKGSYPVYGDYGRFEYLNWACKFFVDANLLEKHVRESE